MKSEQVRQKHELNPRMLIWQDPLQICKLEFDNVTIKSLYDYSNLYHWMIKVNVIFTVTNPLVEDHGSDVHVFVSQR